MATLDLYKKRQPHQIYIEVDNHKKAFLIPTQYTVEEVERLLEIQAEKDELLKQKVEEDSVEAERALATFWDNIYDQLLILFNHYQPEIEKDFLLKYVSRENAIEIIGFFTEQHIQSVEEDAQNVKKKVIVKS
mgnify:CR=1 FL=1|tara:strand:- start:215 stop:613 length:399 start_codon:yes stop_codon:yes gene_type:complete